MRTLDSRLVYQNKWLRFREDRIEHPNGAEGIYSVVEKRPFAVILPWDGQRLTLVQQFRYPVQARFWEFPQGALDNTEGDATPEEIARTELLEETGLRAARLTDLGMLFIAYGITDQRFNAFLAEDLTAGDARPEAEEQGLEVASFTLEEVHTMIRTGQIRDAATLASLYLWRGL